MTRPRTALMLEFLQHLFELLTLMLVICSTALVVIAIIWVMLGP